MDSPTTGPKVQPAIRARQIKSLRLTSVRTCVRGRWCRNPPCRRRLLLRVRRAAGRSSAARPGRDRRCGRRPRGELRGEGLRRPHRHGGAPGPAPLSGCNRRFSAHVRLRRGKQGDVPRVRDLQHAASDEEGLVALAPGGGAPFRWRRRACPRSLRAPPRRSAEAAFRGRSRARSRPCRCSYSEASSRLEDAVGREHLAVAQALCDDLAEVRAGSLGFGAPRIVVLQSPVFAGKETDCLGPTPVRARFLLPLARPETGERIRSTRARA